MLDEVEATEAPPDEGGLFRGAGATGTWGEPPKLVAGKEPSILDRVKQTVREKTGYFEPPIYGKQYREEQPLRTLGKLTGRQLSAYVSGRGLYLPDVFAKYTSGDVTAEDAIDKMTEFDATPKEKQIGEVLKFFGAAYSVHKIGALLGILGGAPKYRTSAAQLSRIIESGKLGTLVEAPRQLSLLLSGSDKYEGAVAPMKTGAMFAGLHFLSLGAAAAFKGGWDTLMPSEQSKALKTLGLKKGASYNQIQDAFRKQARQFHQDKVLGNVKVSANERVKLSREFNKVKKARDALLRRTKPVEDIIKAKQPPKQITGKTQPVVVTTKEASLANYLKETDWSLGYDKVSNLSKQFGIPAARVQQIAEEQGLNVMVSPYENDIIISPEPKTKAPSRPVDTDRFDLSSAVKRRNIMPNGFLVEGSQGVPATNANLKRKIKNVEERHLGLNWAKKKLIEIEKESKENPDADIDYIRKVWGIGDTRITTWTEAFDNLNAQIADSEQYIEDMKLANKAYNQEAPTQPVEAEGEGVVEAKPIANRMAKGKTHAELAEMPIEEYAEIHNVSFQFFNQVKQQMRQIESRYQDEGKPTEFTNDTEWRVLSKQADGLAEVLGGYNNRGGVTEFPSAGQEFHRQLAAKEFQPLEPKTKAPTQPVDTKPKDLLERDLYKLKSGEKPITKETREVLKDKGYTVSEIARLSPDEASYISKGVSPPKPVPAGEKATNYQKLTIHKLGRLKGLVTDEGPTIEYREMARQVTGKSSAKDMSKGEADAFIEAIKTKEDRPEVLKRMARKYGEPTIITHFTDPSYYAHKLGVKSLIEPIEKAKGEFDLELRSAAHELDKMGHQIDKVWGTTAREKARARVKNIPTKAKEELGELLDTYEEAPEDLDPKKKEIFNWFRNLTRTMLERQNEARAALDLEPIVGREAYMRHVVSDAAREVLNNRYPFPEGSKYWSKKVVAGRIYNPMELQRTIEDDLFGIFTKDPIQASKAMVHTALKEIHLNKPIKFFKTQLAELNKDLPQYEGLTPQQMRQLRTSVLPASTRQWLDDYVNQLVIGQETQSDEFLNNLITKTGISDAMNKVLRPFGRILSQKPVTNFFRSMGRLQMAGVLGPRPKLILRNKFQLTQNLGIYTTKANIRAFLPPSEQLKERLNKSLFLRSYTGLEELPKGMANKVENLWHKGYRWSAVSNARQSMEVAYWDTLELIENPKYKGVGFADPMRNYNEPKEFLYPSEKAKLIKEMEFGASATQYNYTVLGMPWLFRNKSLIPFTRLTSWPMNYFFKFHREAIHRFATGSPSWDSNIKLPWSRRIGWLRYATLGGLILNTLNYGRSYMFGAAPTGLPPAAQFMLGLYNYTVTLGAKTEWQKNRHKAAKTQMKYAWKTFIPGYIAMKDFEAFLSGKEDWTDLLFYKK